MDFAGTFFYFIGGGVITFVIVSTFLDDPNELVRVAAYEALRDRGDPSSVISDEGTTLFEFTTDATPTVAEVVAGIDAAMTQALWVTLTPYVVGDYVRNSSDLVYKCVTAGTSGATGPVGTGPGELDGTVVWDYKGPVQNIMVLCEVPDPGSRGDPEFTGAGKLG